MTNTPTLDSAMESLVRRVVKEEIGRELSLPAVAPPSLYALGKLPAITGLSYSALKQLRAQGYLVGDGEGKLARYTVEQVREALRKRADNAGGVRGRALAALKKRRGS